MAIVQTTKTLNGVEYDYTYSDSDVLIEDEDGRQYENVYDVLGSNKTYTETNIPIEDEAEMTEEEIYAQAGRIMLGVE